MASTTRPVILEEEVEMVGLRIEDAIGEDVDEVAERTLHTRQQLWGNSNAHGQHSTEDGHVVAVERLGGLLLLQTTVEVRVRLDDVQMGIL